MITRIRELLEARQLSPTQFADLIGVGRPVISHILSERNKPSLEVVQKIVGAFPDVSLPWLLTGTGPMLAAAVAVPPVAPATTETTQSPLSTAPLAAATPSLPLPAAPVARPAPPAYSAAIAQPSNYPQPPRFRPGAAVAATPARVEVASPPVELAASPTTSMAPEAALANSGFSPALSVATPVAGPIVDVPAAAPTQVPLVPPPTTLTPATASESLATTTNPVAPATEVPTSLPSPEASTPSSNPAAALSFLGEPGKAIRRIVIFYRDGSFSDYLPEGN
jgi:transcriptional regulator with XRE-family HTH domain